MRVCGVSIQCKGKKRSEVAGYELYNGFRLGSLGHRPAPSTA